MRHALLGLGLLLALPAAAQTPDIAANPTLWHVKGAAGDVYLLGSIHILPPQVKWRAPKIAAAIEKSDVFVFEVPLDAASVGKIQDMVLANGYLPANQPLRDMIHPKYRDDFDAAVTASGLDPVVVAHERPWLAGLQMELGQVAKLKFDAGNGADATLMKEAGAAHKEVRYLETIEQQLAVIAPGDAQMDLEEFESGLKDLRDVNAQIAPLVDAWAAGDQKKLAKLVNGDMDKFPKARKALLDDRNARWAPQIEAMLKEKHTFFITVGAGHLTGPAGVPALLRKAGYRVETL